jgi:hypothetical protein
VPIGRIVRALLATSIAASLAVLPLADASAAVHPGVHAAAASPWALLAKKKKKPAGGGESGPKLTPAGAQSKRAAIRSAVQPARDSGDLATVADKLETNAAQLGDPVTMIDASEARLQLADKERSIPHAEQAIADSRIALDMLHHYEAVAAGEIHSDWIVVESSAIAGHVSTAESQIGRAEELIAAIEREKADADKPPPPPGKGEKKRKKRDAQPGTGMIVAGSLFTVVGVGGVAMIISGVAISASKQKEVEGLDMADPNFQSEVDRLDREGKRANLIAYVGAGVAAVGFAVGLPLLIVGSKKRKSAKPAAATALRIAPMWARGAAGLAVSGRF